MLSNTFKVKGNCLFPFPINVLSRISIKNQNIRDFNLAIFVWHRTVVLHLYNIMLFSMFSISMRCSHLNISDIKSCFRPT